MAEPKKLNVLTQAVADWASKNINPQGSYGQAFTGSPEKVHPLSDAGFQKYLGKEYDKGMFPENKDGSYRLPAKTERQITADTTFVKQRMENNRRGAAGLFKLNPNHPGAELMSDAVKLDSMYLNQLRNMYKTGKPIVVNEFDAWKDRKLIKNGRVEKDPITPLNVLQNFTLRPNAEKGTIEYEDIYDLDKIPLIDKIYNPFTIKGTVPGAKYKKSK